MGKEIFIVTTENVGKGVWRVSKTDVPMIEGIRDMNCVEM